MLKFMCTLYNKPYVVCNHIVKYIAAKGKICRIPRVLKSVLHTLSKVYFICGNCLTAKGKCVKLSVK